MQVRPLSVSALLFQNCSSIPSNLRKFAKAKPEGMCATVRFGESSLKLIFPICPLPSVGEDTQDNYEKDIRDDNVGPVRSAGVGWSVWFLLD